MATKRNPPLGEPDEGMSWSKSQKSRISSKRARFAGATEPHADEKMLAVCCVRDCCGLRLHATGDVPSGV
jgi:hypothetical protein